MTGKTPSTLQDFYELMAHSRTIRLRMVNRILDGQAVDKADIALLEDCKTSLESIPSNNEGYQVKLDENRTISIDLSYEIDELAKDLLFLTKGEDALLDSMRARISGFDDQVKSITSMLDGVALRNFISDRDGTVNNYCARYLTSIQSVYNAVFMTRFARKCVKNAVVLTSAPLTNGGMVDISTTPRDAFVGAGSKGREYIDTKGQLGRFPIDPAQQAKLDEFNTRIAALIREPQYEKFALIGSGYQKKFGQVTIARQDMNNSVDAEESRAFLAKIESLLTEIDPERKFFRTEDTGKDIEVLLTVKEDSSDGQLRDFDKGDGVMFLNSSLNLDVARGPNLVCGDTHSDVPMLTACVSACTNTWGVFVTTNEDLKKNVKDATRQSVCVDEPDVLVSALNALAQ